MYRKYIDEKILEVFQTCNIKSFPLNFDVIFNYYNITCFPYTYKDENFREFCLKMSDDAFCWKGLILYNEKVIPGRLNFSFAHELGHIVLQHSQNRSKNIEQEANYFASRLLAPRIAIYYAKCKNLNDVSNLFGLTNEAADYAFQDFRRWHRHITYHKMNEIDKAMYLHFYDEKHKKFVYSIKECGICGRQLINFSESSCLSHHIDRTLYEQPDPLEQSLLIAENKWLYGDL